MSNVGGLYDCPAPPDRLGPTSVPALPIQPPLTPPPSLLSVACVAHRPSDLAPRLELVQVAPPRTRALLLPCELRL